MVDATKPPYEREPLKQKTRVFNRKVFFYLFSSFSLQKLVFCNQRNISPDSACWTPPGQCNLSLLLTSSLPLKRSRVQAALRRQTFKVHLTGVHWSTLDLHPHILFFRDPPGRAGIKGRKELKVLRYVLGSSMIPLLHLQF